MWRDNNLGSLQQLGHQGPSVCGQGGGMVLD